MDASDDRTVLIYALGIHELLDLAASALPGSHPALLRKNASTLKRRRANVCLEDSD